MALLIPFLQACAINIDLEWLAHFLADYGFLYWDMRQSIRGNKSSVIDLVWRECISFMHTDESHKTQYAPMAIMRIFWSQALSPELATIYHRHRTISTLGLPGSNVGWDMPIEKENLSLAGLARPTRERITKHVEELNFLGPVSRGLERLWKARRAAKVHKMKKISDDVAKVVDHLKKVLGSTWAEASVARPQNRSRLVNPKLSPKPWVSRDRKVGANGGQDFDRWLRVHLDGKVTWMLLDCSI